MERVLKNIFTSLVLLLVANICLINGVEAGEPAIYIFGDSIVDVGTNNYLSHSLAIANHAFNGIDFPMSKATGRFSNGYNTADFLVRLMSKEYKLSPPPFLHLLERKSTFKRDLMRGANFASGGSGIINTTGIAFIDVVSMAEQIRQFSTAVTNMTDATDLARTNCLVNKALFIISVGSNDLFEYQLANESSIPPDTFMANLNGTFTNHIKNLYNLGARKFAIIGVPPIGCCPYELSLFGGGVCVKEINDLAQAFYASTNAILQELSSQLPGLVYSLGNAFQIAMDIIKAPSASHFTNVETPCCGNKSFNYTELGICGPTDNLCGDRDDYLFWDWYHPSQAASRLVAHNLFVGEVPYVTPMNFSKLVSI